MLYILRPFLPLRYRRSSLTAVALAVGFFMASVVVFERFGRCNLSELSFLIYHII